MIPAEVHVCVFIGGGAFRSQRIQNHSTSRPRAQAGLPWSTGRHSHHGFRDRHPGLCSAAYTAVHVDLGHKLGRVFVQRPKREWQWVEQPPGRTVVPWNQCGDETRGTEQKTLSNEEPSLGSLLTVQRGDSPVHKAL